MSGEPLNVEDDEPVAPAPAEPAAPAPVAAAPAEPEPEGGELEVGGQRMVPLAALHAERQQRQALSVRAAEADRLAAENAQLRPKAEFFDANRQIFERPVPAPVASPHLSADPDAIEAARLMDFYQADGSPDVERGAKWLALQDRRAAGRVAEAVAPMRQQTAQDQSAVNFQRALQVKDADGRTPSQESLRAVWSAMPPEYTADQRVAGILAATAMGLDRMATKTGAAVPLPSVPLVTESIGGAPRTRAALTPLGEKLAKDRGKTQAQWSALGDNYRAGRPTVLEDD